MLEAEWIKKYYPVPAKDCPEKDAIDHAILKWEGIIAWMRLNPGCWRNIPIRVDAATCALCNYHYEDTGDGPSCQTCPLSQYLGNPCDDRGPWNIWKYRHDPFPMLEALLATKEADEE